MEFDRRKPRALSGASEGRMVRVMRAMVLIGSVAAASTPGGVGAEPARTGDKKLIARRYMAAGLAAQQTGDYGIAVTMYWKAYQLVAHPVLIFDIAQAHRLAGHLAEAVRQYEQYVAVEPSGPEAQTARRFIAELEIEMRTPVPAADDRPGSDRVPKGDSAPSADRAGAVTSAADETSSVVQGTRASEIDGNAAPPPREAVADRPGEPVGRTTQIVGLATVGTGAAALAVGIDFGLHARTLAREVAEQFDQGKYDAGSRANKIALAGYISGGVLLATGAALYWQGHAQDRVSMRAVVVPSISNHGAGLALAASWP